MILTGNEIIREVENRRICISPFLKENVNPNSYNYRLDEAILEFEPDLIDAKRKPKYKKIKLTEKGYCLQPGKLYLGNTVEKIGSDNYVTQLIGRSSVGRLGLFLQITASLGHVGSKHKWTLELTCIQPIIVYPYMKIGQVSFWSMQGSKEIAYIGKYQGYNEPHISEFYHELDKTK
ncbi:dCTP deaminase [[Clostridium] polysaccharolyticum]|uniref:dCTP deaminase n=1 Tax=[Clostridium] polysaccharolyticum TaxID=29364 RepID=A0A1I0G405_9FIRM|nr:hypothetical protein [[Clostridium] polysaccharolyticum]SET64624.1 dCTP deaminase [[Clostridium] polysaccharolyticum]